MLNIDKSVKAVVEKWLEKNNQVLLDNISDTIKEWLEDNKQEIFNIIEEQTKNGGH
jgi:hypothetical protein